MLHKGIGLSSCQAILLIVAAPATNLLTLFYAFIYVVHIYLSDTIILDDLQMYMKFTYYALYYDHCISVCFDIL